MKKNGAVKRILYMSVVALVASWVAVTSAAPRVIDIEPEQCQTRCFYIFGVPVYCYEICF